VSPAAIQTDCVQDRTTDRFAGFVDVNCTSDVSSRQTADPLASDDTASLRGNNTDSLPTSDTVTEVARNGPLLELNVMSSSHRANGTSTVSCEVDRSTGLVGRADIDLCRPVAEGNIGLCQHTVSSTDVDSRATPERHSACVENETAVSLSHVWTPSSLSPKTSTDVPIQQVVYT